MACKILALLLAVMIGVSHSLPARIDPDDIELVDPVGALEYEDSPAVGFGAGFPDFSLPDFSAFQDYINSVRASIAAAIAGATPGFGRGNTTSETRIIDGNRVTVNRTEYNENGVHVVVKNVEVQPVSGESTGTPNQTGTAGSSGSSGSAGSTGTTTAIPAITATSAATAATTTRPREDIETFAENTNERRQSGAYDNVESFVDEYDFRPHSDFDVETFDILPIERDLSNDINVNTMAKRHYDHYNDDDVEEIDVNSINELAKQQQQQQQLKAPPQASAGRDVEEIEGIEGIEEVFRDLSGDTYVNDLLSRKLEAEAEWEFRELPYQSYQVRPAAYNTYTVSDDGTSGYRDLSRDTYVNEVAARRGVPKNPDAEEFVIASDALRKRHS